jgi:hypothetical protein
VRRTALLSLLLAVLLAGCPVEPEPEPEAPAHPTLIVRPGHKQVVLDRIGTEPWATVYGQLVGRADSATREPSTEGVWDPSANGTNCSTAQDAAFLAWLHDDADRAARSKELLLSLPVDFRTNNTWDINIRMPGVLINCTNAWDLLLGAGFLTEAESADAEARITSITQDFYADYVLEDLMRNLVLRPAQNNHPIRTATAIGYVALAFPDHWQAGAWGDWAFSELDYLWGPTGKYVLPDGGVSEGPFYFGFAWAPSVATFIAMENLGDRGRTDFVRDCSNRNDADPWTDHGCVDGEAFTFDNPLRDPAWHATMEWSMALRLPWGSRPPKADAYFNSPPGQALVVPFGGPDTLTWDWLDNRDEAFETTHGQDLIPHHLAWLEVTGDEGPPAWTSRFLPDAGDMIFRSSWQHDAVWGLLIAEHGPARKTLHDHVDGTSFSMAAFGEYLLVDPGYYKPVETDNARTAHSWAHNLVLIEGEAAPDKGLLTDFGDADAWLENPLSTDRFEYAEARQDYQDSTVVRSALMVDGRWFLLADRLGTTAAAAREHAWRMSGYAGQTAGGTYTARADGARWERELAGVDVWVASTAAGMAVVEPPLEEWYPPQVHEFEHDRQEAHHVTIDGLVTAEAPDFLAVLAPYRVGGPEEAATVTPLDVGEGVAGWSIAVDGVDWVALLRTPDASQTIVLPDGTEVVTDAEATLFEVEGPAALLVRGTSLAIDGVARVEGGDAATVASVE